MNTYSVTFVITGMISPKGGKLSLLIGGIVVMKSKVLVQAVTTVLLVVTVVGLIASALL